MASKRDLVEAHAFNRRRLVTAFTSGAPGGRELEPPRPWRALVAGGVLAGLLVAVVAVVGYLRPGLPADWDSNRLIVAQDSGSRYVTTGDGVLRPVLNIASARLLLPDEQDRIVAASDTELAEIPRGAAVGIPGAPDSLPAPDRLVQSEWTSCLGFGGRPELRIGGAPVAERSAVEDAVVVTVGDERWVVWNGTRFPVDAAAGDGVLRALGLDASRPRSVPPGWLNLFPPGPELRAFSVPNAGDVPPADADLPADVAVGSVVEVGSAAGASNRYVVVPRGLVPLTDVAYGLYRIDNRAEPITVTQSQLSGLRTVDASSTYEERWPADLPRPWTDDAAICALLSAEPGEVPAASLARLIATADDPPAGGGVVVEPGAGALVRSVSGSVVDRGTVHLVDSIGRRYALGAGARGQLGYTEITPVPVPQAWLEPLADGPQLSSGAAGRSPGGT